MTRTGVAALSLRLAGLYLMLGTLMELSNLAIFSVAWVDGDGSQDGLLAYVVWILVRAVSGVLLFLAAPRLARVVSDGDEPLRLEDHSVIGTIAIRLAAIVLWDAALALIPSLEPQPSRDPDSMYMVVPLASMLVLAGLGAWLFVSAAGLGARVFGSRAASPATTSTARLASIAFSAVGLWILASNLPGFATSAASLITLALDGEFGLRSGWVEVLASGIRVALGTFLFLGAGGVAHVWHTLSTAGLRQRNNTA